jgi:hypothetical protein
MVAVKFDDILEVFEFVSFEGMLENHAFLDRTTGKVVWISEDLDEWRKRADWKSGTPSKLPARKRHSENGGPTAGQPAVVNRCIQR